MSFLSPFVLSVSGSFKYIEFDLMIVISATLSEAIHTDTEISKQVKAHVCVLKSICFEKNILSFSKLLYAWLKRNFILNLSIHICNWTFTSNWISTNCKNQLLFEAQNVWTKKHSRSRVIGEMIWKWNLNKILRGW